MKNSNSYKINSQLLLNNQIKKVENAYNNYSNLKYKNFENHTLNSFEFFHTKEKYHKRMNQISYSDLESMDSFSEIEKEPDDISNYSCLSFSKILNNCNPKDYKWELFPNEIAANQLKQEGGTCYMVSALEAMSHVPFLLNYIFNTFDTTFSQFSKKYKVKFWNKSYIVLNQFPIYYTNSYYFDKFAFDNFRGYAELKFMKPLEKEAYAIIFEKVWAVIRGGYNKLDGGKSKEVFKEVFGKSSQHFYNEKMKVFDLEIGPIRLQEIIHTKKSDEYWIKAKIPFENNLINPKNVFETIENAFKKDGAIITASINMIGNIETKLKKKKYTNKKENQIYQKLYDVNFVYTILGIHEEENQVFVKIKTSDNFLEKSELKKEDHFYYKIFYIPQEYFEFYNGGHAYSILGTYSPQNPWTGKIQHFVILKNPWRSGDDIREKINIKKIEKQISGFNDIININKKHYETGVFYMPKEYFEGWFRDIIICTPNYKENYPKVYENLELYKTISEYYKINSSQYFFNFNQGNQLIKTDIISKNNLNSNNKLIQQIKSNFVYDFKKDSMETIFWSGKNAYNFKKTTDEYIVQKGFKYEVKKGYELNEDDFCGGKFIILQ